MDRPGVTVRLGGRSMTRKIGEANDGSQTCVSTAGRRGVPAPVMSFSQLAGRRPERCVYRPRQRHQWACVDGQFVTMRFHKGDEI
jgi:hypothetical protein